MARTKKLIVLCDGTWAGRETGMNSNIRILATMIGIEVDAQKPSYELEDGARGISAKYFEGVGTDGSFLSYLWDGAFAADIRKDCTAVYDFIVRKYTPNHEIWMFGLSRGAYTVRSVAGMINNCGIVKNPKLVEMVYDIYRSPYDVNKPNTAEMKAFRNSSSHGVKRPIKFMGILDTVGQLGIPRLDFDTGVGFEWVEFHDKKISSEVEKVYHAVSLHDRMWVFSECLASRNKKHADNPKSADLKIYQKWFPGTHYDLGRCRWKFLRQGTNIVEKALFTPVNYLSRTIYPNEILSGLVLMWILEGVNTEGGARIIVRSPSGRDASFNTAIQELKTHIRGTNATGSGDVYDKLIDYAPLGRLNFIPGSLIWLAEKVWPVGSEINTVKNIFLGTKDRIIPDPGLPESSYRKLVQHDVYDYKTPDKALGGSVIEERARIPKRYPSRTYEKYLLYMQSR